MRPINFDWEKDTATIEWLAPTAALIRFLYPEPNSLPFRGVCSVAVKNQTYEFKGMVFRASDDAPTIAEHRSVKNYLSSLGYQGMSRRLKNGKVVVKQYGSPAKTIKEKSMQISVSFDVKNDDGSEFAKITADYAGVSPNGVANMEGLLITGFLQPLVEIAKAQAAPAA